jgi:hypothetical protein
MRNYILRFTTGVVLFLALSSSISQSPVHALEIPLPGCPPVCG